MHQILPSIEPVIPRARYVSINEDALADFARTVQPEEFDRSEMTNETVLP